MKEVLKGLRKEFNMNQQQMADLLNISYSHYVKLENEFVNPSYEVLRRLKIEFQNLDMNLLFK